MAEPKFAAGDQVIYTNANGVCWGRRTIREVDLTSFRAQKWGPHYYIEPTDAPWFSVEERLLQPAPPKTPEEIDRESREGAW